MKKYIPLSPRGMIEPLEQRIAPALIEGNFISIVAGSAQLLTAGQGLSTSSLGGSYLLYVEAGQALVFTTDLNNNQQIDYNEITGIAAGDGLKLISFVDIHGDIVTNLNADGTLTDSDNNASNGRDGQLLLDSDIKRISLRSLTAADLADPTDIQDRLALSSYSIFGNIYAGGDLGTKKSAGLVIDPAGKSLQSAVFAGGVGVTRYVDSPSQIGSIKVGTAASGESFSFGVSSSLTEVKGVLDAFLPQIGARGSDIRGISAVDLPPPPVDPDAPPPDPDAPPVPPPDLTTPFGIGTLQAGDGGFGGRGGNIRDIQLFGDVGGYRIIAGNAGDGKIGPAGGSIVNFSDQGSVTSRILLQTGNGGEGVLGQGGRGGNLVFTPGSPVEFAGHVEIVLGDGGDGYSQGGNGAGLAVANIVTPETAVPVAKTLVSTTREIGDIGNSRPIDFDHDGFSDVVFSTVQPDQIVVVFGFDPLEEAILPRTAYLDAPVNPDALVVADFNGDGFDDIASASANSSFAGVLVYRNLGISPSGVYEGFTDPLFSPLPGLTPRSDLVPGTFLDFFQRAVPITDLAAADFDGDGVMDLAVNSVQELIPLRPYENGDVVILMKGDTDFSGTGTGYFYADFTDPLDPSLFANPTIDLGQSGAELIFKASALTTATPAEVVVAGREGAKELNVLGLDVNGVGADGTATFTLIGLGKVDTNRKLAEGALPLNQNIALVDATLRDFVLLDINQDGKMDAVALTQAPDGFLVTFKGDANGGLKVASTTTADGQNSGIKVAGPKEDGGLGITESENFVGILATNANDFPATDSNDPTRSAINDIALINYDSDTNKSLGILELTLTDVPQPPSPPLPLPPVPQKPPGFLVANATVEADYIPVFRPLGFDESIKAFDTYYQPLDYPGLPGPELVSYAIAIPAPGASVSIPFIVLPDPDDPDELPFLSDFGTPLADNTVLITAGSGGDSVIGAGGAGGSLGRELKPIVTIDPITGVASVTFQASLTITLPVTTSYAGTIRLTSGSGGDGFTDGGHAGDLTGVKVQYAGSGVRTSVVLLSAGFGGDGFIGTGGDGGSLTSFLIDSGVAFIGGRGGDGIRGGDGGSVVGNQFEGIRDNVAEGRLSNSLGVVIIVQGGDGGDGLKAGGDGGKIDHFVSEFQKIVGDASGGLLHYTAGDGGDSESGVGGKGGSIISSSPFRQNNNLAGDLFVSAGDGGDGDTGGRGGSVKTFFNSPTTGQAITSVSVLAGYGGSGGEGDGGRGGNVRNVDVSGGGQGFAYEFDFSNPENVVEAAFKGFFLPAGDISFGRVIAGQGGNSFGGEGGNGGSLVNVAATAGGRAMAAVAGRGGDGLTVGGKGGSVINAEINSANIDVPGNPPFGKVLVIAGDGGDAFASKGTGPGDPTAFGGVNGIGGNGGSIKNFFQNSSTETNFDFIAGNGGNTVNSGSAISSTTLVGKGGSITNLHIVGNIGNPDPDVPIKAYNDIASGELVADFVLNVLLRTPDLLLNDDFGNVGMVVGASGRVADNDKNGELDPATAGVNGSAIDISARNITSAVAGSVDQIAGIQLISGMRVIINGGVVGADKIPVNSFDYLDANGLPTNTAQPGGALIDGAIFTKKIINSPDLIGEPRVFFSAV